MPKKTAINPLDWDRAVQLFGEEAIRGAARSPQTLSNWKTRGVPADVVVPMLLDMVRQRKGHVAEEPRYETPPPGVDPDAWPAIRELLPRLSLIYTAQQIEAHARRWGWVTGTIETFSDMVRADVERLRKGRRKVAPRG